MGQLDGKVAIVTGSGRGIGQQVALRLARDGAAVVVNDLDDGPARDTIGLIEKLGGRATLHVLDTAGHGYKILKKSRASDEDVFTEMARVLRDWASKLVQSSHEHAIGTAE